MPAKKNPSIDREVERLHESARLLNVACDRHRTVAFAAAAYPRAAESFGEEIKRAIDRDPRSRQAAAERAAKERNRYRKRQPRKPTKSG
jgi:hypothetical protein